jgi:hypothetical protein
VKRRRRRQNAVEGDLLAPMYQFLVRDGLQLSHKIQVDGFGQSEEFKRLRAHVKSVGKLNPITNNVSAYTLYFR